MELLIYFLLRNDLGNFGNVRSTNVNQLDITDYCVKVNHTFHTNKMYLYIFFDPVPCSADTKQFNFGPFINYTKENLGKLIEFHQTQDFLFRLSQSNHIKKVAINQNSA